MVSAVVSVDLVVPGVVVVVVMVPVGKTDDPTEIVAADVVAVYVSTSVTVLAVVTDVAGIAVVVSPT